MSLLLSWALFRKQQPLPGGRYCVCSVAFLLDSIRVFSFLTVAVAMTSNHWLAGLPIAPKCPTCDVRLLNGRCLDCGLPIAEEAEKPKNEQKRRREQSVQMDLFGRPVSERLLREQFDMLNTAPPPLELLIAAGQVVVRKVVLVAPERVAGRCACGSILCTPGFCYAHCPMPKDAEQTLSSSAAGAPKSRETHGEEEELNDTDPQEVLKNDAEDPSAPEPTEGAAASTGPAEPMLTLACFLAMGSFYSVLGCQPGASSHAIRKAFHKRRLRYHPDKGGDGAAFAYIAFVYETLAPRAKRTMYAWATQLS